MVIAISLVRMLIMEQICSSQAWRCLMRCPHSYMGVQLD